MWDSAANGDLGTVRYCLEALKIDLNEQDDNHESKRTALHWASINGHSAVVGYLLAQKARFDIIDAQGKFAWEEAVGSLEIIQIFQEMGNIR